MIVSVLAGLGLGYLFCVGFIMALCRAAKRGDELQGPYQR